MLIASTTKILTALVVLENSDVNDNVVIGNDFPAIEGSSIYLKTGEELTVLELLYGLLLESEMTRLSRSPCIYPAVWMHFPI